MGSNYYRSCFPVIELLVLCTVHGIYWILRRHQNSKAGILHSVTAVWVSPVSHCSCSWEHNISKKFPFFLLLDLLKLFLSFWVVFWTVSTAGMRAILWISLSSFLSFMVVVPRYLNKSPPFNFLAFDIYFFFRISNLHCHYIAIFLSWSPYHISLQCCPALSWLFHVLVPFLLLNLHHLQRIGYLQYYL